jgi:hypothetical protein
MASAVLRMSSLVYAKWRAEQVSRLLRRFSLTWTPETPRRSGRPPFGFFAVDGRLVPNDVEQATLARMTELREQGATISAAIAREFQRTMTPMTVKRILDRQRDLK